MVMEMEMFLVLSAEHALALLDPLFRLYPQRLVRAFLHAWEKELTQKSSHNQNENDIPSNTSRIDENVRLLFPWINTFHHPISSSIDWSIGGYRHTCYSTFFISDSFRWHTTYLPGLSQSQSHHSIVECPRVSDARCCRGIHRSSCHVSYLRVCVCVCGSFSQLSTIMCICFYDSAVIRSRESDRELSKSVSTQSKNEMTPLKIHETAALHFLDSYLKQCTITEMLVCLCCTRISNPNFHPEHGIISQSNAWSPLLHLVKEALSRSDHPFTFLWLLGMMQQYFRRCDISELQAKTQKELRESMSTLLNAICLIAGRVRKSINSIAPLPTSWYFVDWSSVGALCGSQYRAGTIAICCVL